MLVRYTAVTLPSCDLGRIHCPTLGSFSGAHTTPILGETKVCLLNFRDSIERVSLSIRVRQELTNATRQQVRTDSSRVLPHNVPSWRRVAVAVRSAGVSRLQFDGIDDRVTFGTPSLANELGASELSRVELWFKKTGAGRDDDDGDRGRDCRRSRCWRRGAARATTRPAARTWTRTTSSGSSRPRACWRPTSRTWRSGGNHPVRGRTAICDNVWYHAAATYDGTTWRVDPERGARCGTPSWHRPRAPNQRPSASQTAFSTPGLAPALTSTGAVGGLLQRADRRSAHLERGAQPGRASRARWTQPLFAAQTNLIGRWGSTRGRGPPPPARVGTPPTARWSPDQRRALRRGPAGPLGFAAPGAGSGNEALRLTGTARGLRRTRNRRPRAWRRPPSRWRPGSMRDRHGSPVDDGYGRPSRAVPLVTKGRGEEARAPTST